MKTQDDSLDNVLEQMSNLIGFSNAPAIHTPTSQIGRITASNTFMPSPNTNNAMPETGTVSTQHSISPLNKPTISRTAPFVASQQQTPTATAQIFSRTNRVLPSATPAGFTGLPITNREVPRGEVNAPPRNDYVQRNGSPQPLTTECPSGQILNQETGECYTPDGGGCPSGQFLNPVNNSCYTPNDNGGGTGGGGGGASDGSYDYNEPIMPNDSPEIVEKKMAAQGLTKKSNNTYIWAGAALIAAVAVVYFLNKNGKGK